MAEHTFVIEIAAPREAVFDMWVDVERMPEWTEGLTRVTDVAGRLGATGTRYAVWFGRMRGDVLVSDGARPHRFDRQVRMGPLRAEFQSRLDETPTGTRLTETVRTRGVLAGVWALILSTGSWRGSFRGELATFASICERAAGSP